MSCNGVLIPTPSGEKICIPLYVEELKWPPKDPEPDPWRRIFDDIRTLAIINKGIARISDQRVRDILADAVRSAARNMELPKGVELGDRLFKGQMAMEAAE